MKNLTITIAVSLCCLLLFNCNKDEDLLILEFDRDTFEQEWALWESLGITSYSFDYRESIGGPTRHHFRFTVTDGQVTDTEYLDEYLIDYNGQDFLCRGCDYDCRQHSFAKFGTISNIFAWVELTEKQILAEGIRESVYSYISILYNDQYHFPDKIYVGMEPRDKLIFLDGEPSMYIVSNFQPKF